MDTIYYYLAGIVVLLIVLLLISRRAGWSLTEVRQVIASLVEAAEQMSLVEAAEQMTPGKTGQEKLEWVMERAGELGITKYVNAILLRAMIESSVYWLSHNNNNKLPPPDAAPRWPDRG